MKRHILIVALLLLEYGYCFADSENSTIYTKGGQAVHVVLYEEFDADDIQILNELYCAYFPHATLVENSSGKYNCHSYAWNISDGGTLKCWINRYYGSNEPNIAKYWTNDYYTETTEANAKKIFYYNSDHSAVTSTVVPGMYESKWGQAPLMRHSPGYGPYPDMASRHYYYHYVPKAVYGALTCSNGIGSIRKNMAADYRGSFSFTGSYTMEYNIYSPKGEDAIEEGSAIVNSTLNDGINVTFTRAGVYEMSIRFYTRFNELIGDFFFEPIVIN